MNFPPVEGMIPSLLRNPLLLIVIGILLVGMGLYSYFSAPTPTPSPEEIHIHADFALFIDGQKWNFSQEKYMSTEGHRLNPNVHLHDGDGDVLHVHAPQITLGDFFTSINMPITTGRDTVTLLTDDNQTISAQRIGCYSRVPGEPTLCVNPAPDAEAFQVIINSQPYEGVIEDYVIRDLDRILITYGRLNETRWPEQYALVTDQACIQSGKCPERGAPRDESSCTTSGGCAVGHIAT